MSRLFEVEVFVRVVEEGSLTAAGRRLGVTSSYASKLVTRLEERLGVPLLLRTTRKLTLTAAGQRYFATCLEVLESLDQAELAATALQSTPTGTLRVTLATGLGIPRMRQALADFVELYPKLVLELAFFDRQVDLLGEGYDVALRVGAVEDTSLIARKLGITNRVLFASPRYLERAGPIDVPEDLAAHECLLYAYNARQTVWTLRGPDGNREVKVSGRMVANQGRMLVAAATHGCGIIYVPSFHVLDALRAGELVRVLPGWSRPLDIYALYAPMPRVPSKVRVFVDFIVARFKELFQDEV